MSSNKPGSIIGGILLISGSCIGAGMLGIPIITGIAGFYPTLLMFFCVWAFMTLTGLLLVEVNCWFSNQVNILTMVGTILGRFYRMLSWILYLVLFYSLLVAYSVLSGNLFGIFSLSFFSLSLPDWVGSLFFVLIFGWIVYLGTKTVDITNRFLMIGKIICYVALVLVGLRYVSAEKLVRSNLSYTLMGLPVLVASFGFHNMIPTVTAYMKGNLKRVRYTIVGGSLFTLVIYVIWELIVLGIVPLEGDAGITAALANDQDASTALFNNLGISWVSGLGQGLAFFAILTSFLAQSLGLVHFWEDGLQMPFKKRENPVICLLALGPPLIVSMINPHLFFQTLNFAGGFCAVILFGIFPCWMIWKGRYQKNMLSPHPVFGGKLLIIAVFAFSMFILLYQLYSMFT